MSGCLLVRKSPLVPFCGAQRVLDRLVQIATRGGLAEVVGELTEMRFELGRVERLDHLRDAAVQAQATRGADLLVERLADQRVGEAVRPGSPC